MNFRSCVAAVVAFAGVALGAAPEPQLPTRGQLVSIWVRPTGAAERKYVTVDLAAKPKTEFTRADIQYNGAKRRYRGVSLRALLDTLEHRGRTDLALLHFLNGMVIPLPIDDLELLKELDPIVATEIEFDDEWTTSFPEVRKKGAEARDHRPLVFQGNKVVVATARYPFVSESAAKEGFTPFFYADSLTGIEFVNTDAWYKQFDVGLQDEEKKGFKLFHAYCQYCHAIRGVGGTYGIDYLKPSPVTERKNAQDLFLHVKYRDRNAAETGQMMPFFKDLSKDDVKAIYTWLLAVAKARPVPYTEPSHH